MSADRIPGPRSGTTGRLGAIQIPALAAERGIRMPSDWIGELCRVSWSPSVDGEKLYYVFIPDPDRATDSPTLPSIEDAAASTQTGTVVHSRVEFAPDWIEAGSDDIEVPLEHRYTGSILLVKPEGSAGRFLMRQAER